MRIGIVDLGTNSLRFAIYEVRPRGRPLCLYKRKLMLRPGQGVYSAGRLKSGTIRKVVAAFKGFKSQADRFHVTKINAVATSALREAANAGELVRKVARKTGIHLRVISGATEAHLISKGILGFEDIRRRCVLIDIGGGSTELSLCANGKRLKSVSLRLGALRLQQLYLPKATLKQIDLRLAGVALLQRVLQRVFSEHLHGWRGQAPLAIGSSGTARAVARLIDRKHARALQTKSSNRKPKLKFTRTELHGLVERMLVKSKAELGHMPGMEQRRLDNILGGAILLLALMDYLQIERLQTTNFALRDGLLLTARNQR